MIKALIDTPAAGPGAKLVVLGLSAENILRMRQGKPILVNLADLGLPHQLVALTAGETEQQLLADLEAELGTAGYKVES